MEQNETIYAKKDVIEKYKPMFTEWSLSKLIRQGKIKYIRIGRRIFIKKQAVEEFIKEQEWNSVCVWISGITKKSEKRQYRRK